MTAFREIARTPCGKLICSAALLLLFLQIFLFALCLRKRSEKEEDSKGIGKPIGAGLHLLCGIVLITLLFDSVYTLGYLPYERSYPAFVNFFSGLPWLVPVLLEALSALISASALALHFRARRRRLSPLSVKQTLDLLPVGVCIGGEDGSVLLSNLKMNETAELLTGKALTDVGALIGDLDARKQEDVGGRMLIKQDNRVFVFEQSDLRLDGRSLTELIAEEQTGQFRAVKELEERTARLRNLQYRLKAFRVREEDLITKQEILAARTAIHRELGGALLTGKYYLEHPENVDEKELLALMRQINDYLLAEIEEPEDKRDEIDYALKMAHAIGVQVEIRGELPEDGPFRTLVGQAIAECAANTVKHAAGDLLSVTLDGEGENRRALFTNNGEPPPEEIPETGGLLQLRYACMQAHAEMTVRSTPAFSLEITMKREPEAGN